MTENIVTGKKYRILTDAANDIWDRISFWSKASDVQYDDNTTAEANKAVAILKRNASYTVGAVAYEPSAPSWVLLKCTQAGTTAAVIPSTYSTISSVGTVITDGTARFTVYDVRPSGTLSNSAYQVPAMSLVNSLSSELTANGNKFYFDYQNSKYGYNTSASRAAATFVPFGGSTEYKDFSTSITASKTNGSVYFQSVSGSTTINVSNGSKTIIGYGLSSISVTQYNNGVSVGSITLASLSLTNTTIKISYSGNLYGGSMETGSIKFNYNVRVFYS